MNLPDLKEYRNHFIAKGVQLPLPVVAPGGQGMLERLPRPPDGKTGWPWDQQADPEIYDDQIAWPRLTIVTPSYNQGDFLEQTIRSVLLQNYPNLEYILMDGGSTDHSSGIIEKYAPHLSYYQSEKDTGQSNAINRGFSLSSGDYHAWINSDDFYLKGVFNKVIRRFTNSGVDFIYGYGNGYDVASGDTTTVRVMPFIDYFIKIPTLVQPSTFWSSGIHEPVWEDLHCALDFELWLRLVKGHRRALIKEPLSVANIHDQAKTHSANMKVKWEEDHHKIWSHDAHGPVPEWKRIVFLNRIRIKLYKIFKLL
ncbi:MAG: glycosyltransferase family 2 protein [Mucilaginibacter sp.]|jgi:glycosyltransferase involved in cell wall biosynthesis|uniref:glycosyltransferase family 2 protein n=1 Tax=Mucilaginibacter sp. TaxID=1882438 RepID=UPI00356AD4CC